jgi:hypothetical protein
MPPKPYLDQQDSNAVDMRVVLVSEAFIDDRRPDFPTACSRIPDGLDGGPDERDLAGARTTTGVRA